MSKRSNEGRSVTWSTNDRDDFSPLWSTKKQHSFFLMISFSAGMISATAFMRYGYPYLYRLSQSFLKDIRPSHDSKPQGGHLDSSAIESSESRDLTPSSPAKVKARWPWDRLKTKQHSSENAFNPSQPIILPSDVNAPQFGTEEEDEFGKNQHCCIGSIFGIDVGGTLAKLCYFERVPLAVRSLL